MSEEIGANTNYSVAYATQYIFTALEFNCSGAVTGWTTLALDGAARGRPEISIWTPSDTSEYTKYVYTKFTANLSFARDCMITMQKSWTSDGQLQQ